MIFNSKRILLDMIRIYEAYKFVRFVEKKSDQRSKVLLPVIKKTFDEQKLNQAFLDELLHLNKAIEEFGETHIFLRKVGDVKASRIINYAEGHDYVEQYMDESGLSAVRLRHPKGSNIADGIPFFRIGLWNAWRNEYGSLVVLVFVTLGAGAVLREIIPGFVELFMDIIKK